MKRAISIALLGIMAACQGYANPLLGRWRVFLVDPSESLAFSFIDDDSFTIADSGGNDDEQRSYSYDPYESTLSLGEIDGVNYKTRIEFSGPSRFRLFFHEDAAIDFLSGLRMDFPDEGELSKMNQVGRQFVTQLKEGMQRLLTSIPIADGRKIQ